MPADQRKGVLMPLYVWSVIKKQQQKIKQNATAHTLIKTGGREFENEKCAGTKRQ